MEMSFGIWNLLSSEFLLFLLWVCPTSNELSYDVLNRNRQWGHLCNSAQGVCILTFCLARMLSIQAYDLDEADFTDANGISRSTG